MNRDELLNLHDEITGKAFELMKRKNHDYAGGANRTMPFANFTRCEEMGFSSTEQGFGVRLTDKLSRLSTFCEGGILKVRDESLEDTILDIINYVILFYGYVSSKKERELNASKYETNNDGSSDGSSVLAGGGQKILRDYGTASDGSEC